MIPNIDVGQKSIFDGHRNPSLTDTRIVCSVVEMTSLTAKRSVKKTVPIGFNVDRFNAAPKFLDINLMQKKM